MKRLVKKAEGFWAGNGRISQDALDFIRQNLKEDNSANQIGTDNTLQYSFGTVILSMPFGYLTQKYGQLDPGQVGQALQNYSDYFASLIVNKLTQANPSDTRNPDVSIDIGVSMDGQELYMKGQSTSLDMYTPDSEYVDGTHW